jgi:hypothetical protein
MSKFFFSNTENSIICAISFLITYMGQCSPFESGCLVPKYTGRFIIFSMITNIYNKKTKGPTYHTGIVHSPRKTEKVFFLQLEKFDVCTTGDTAHISSSYHTLVNMHRYSYTYTRIAWRQKCELR